MLARMFAPLLFATLEEVIHVLMATKQMFNSKSVTGLKDFETCKYTFIH